MNALVTANLTDSALNHLEINLDLDIQYRPIKEREALFSPAELQTLLSDTEIFIVGYEGVTADLLDDTDIEIVACTRGGPDANIDIEAATDRGIPILYTPGRNAESVADFTVGLMIGVIRHIPNAHQLLHDGMHTGKPVQNKSAGGSREDVVWGVSRNSPYMILKGIELSDRTLGIIGFGAIGREVAQRVQGFDMDIVAYDPYVEESTMAEHGVENVDLDQLCKKSDIITVHAVVTEETRGLIGEHEFSLMKDEAYFINTARAAIADQEALIETLERDGLNGAALDVYDQEPLPENHRLFAFDNVVTTPHIAPATSDVIKRHSQMIVSDLERLLTGQTPEHVFNESALKLPTDY